jgi:hypothetical protein
MSSSSVFLSRFKHEVNQLFTNDKTPSFIFSLLVTVSTFTIVHSFSSLCLRKKAGIPANPPVSIEEKTERHPTGAAHCLIQLVLLLFFINASVFIQSVNFKASIGAPLAVHEPLHAENHALTNHTLPFYCG